MILSCKSFFFSTKYSILILSSQCIHVAFVCMKTSSLRLFAVGNKLMYVI